jgi:hypothetical protein
MLLIQYFSYPMEVKVDILTASEIQFPSVTLCNLNPIRADALRESQQFRPLVHYTDQIKNDDQLYNYMYSNFDQFCEFS